VTVVLLATDAYGGHGGIALFNRELAAALALHSDVVVIPRIVPHEPEAIPPGITFHRDAARSRLAYARAVARTAFARPELVICGHVNLLPVACAISPHPVLMTFGIEAWKPRLGAGLNRLVQRCRAVVSISALTRDRFVSWSGFRGPTYILPNPIRAERYGIRPRRLDLVARYGLAGKRVLLTVGRLAGEERYKGFDEVLDVLGDLPSDVVYLIAGGGNDQPRLRLLADELGISDRVRFTGGFREEDKPDLYSLADVCVMPSRGEGFGFVFLEALASGVSVVGSKYDGGREALMDGKLGLLVDPANPAEIRAAIAELLARGTRRVPEELAYFSFENFARRLAEIMARVGI
jgi:glycosyltransferase involved in cell wall biosynthesis